MNLAGVCAILIFCFSKHALVGSASESWLKGKSLSTIQCHLDVCRNLLRCEG